MAVLESNHTLLMAAVGRERIRGKSKKEKRDTVRVCVLRIVACRLRPTRVYQLLQNVQVRSFVISRLHR